MRKKYIFLSCLAIFTFMPMSMGYTAEKTNNVGDIHIRDNPKIEMPKTAVDLENVKKREMTEANNHVGGIQIFQDVLRDKKRHKKVDSQEVLNLKTRLLDVIELGNKKRYDQAVMIMDELIRQHPETMTLYKWAAVYANLAGDYDDSKYRFDDMRLQFPLSKDQIDADLMIRYYEIDNARHSPYLSKENLLQKIEQEKQYLQNIPDTQYKNLKGESEKNIMLFLMDYQRFLLISDDGAYIESSDIDSLWSRLAVKKQTSLDDFYGFDIDQLTFLYAKHYNRKDLMEVYLAHNAETTNQNIIKQIKTVKSLLAKQN
ncbi:hypothetical protein ACTNDZ_11060 [Selenomonas montiformis]|uniref:hypothetical protein n=1 Tax=Selenomonas montiformis TaxID=2652285 RepID=UPI003F89CAB0